MRSSAATPVEAADGDAAFHRLLTSYTKNGALLVLIGGLIDASRKGAYAVYSLPETAARSLDQHRRDRRRPGGLRRRAGGASSRADT